MIRVLLIEDEMDLAQTLIQFMGLEGMVPDHANNGIAGLELVRKNHYDVLVLDIGLPRLNGLELCDALRKEGVDTPVLMLTARDSLDDKLAGFAAGSDDYLVKPFEMAELFMRIKALARRRSGQVRRLQLADLTLDLDRQQAVRNNKSLKLTPTTWALLETLLRASPGTVSRGDLEFALWGEEVPDSNSLKVHMFHLRKQLEQKDLPTLLHTIPGQGWALLEKERVQ